jgi:hypothetical protein
MHAEKSYIELQVCLDLVDNPTLDSTILNAPLTVIEKTGQEVVILKRSLNIIHSSTLQSIPAVTGNSPLSTVDSILSNSTYEQDYLSMVSDYREGSDYASDSDLDSENNHFSTSFTRT